MVVGLTELSEFSCKSEWYFNCSTCRCTSKCSYITFCTNHKYERDRTMGDRMNSDQFRGGNGPSQFCLFTFSHALEMFIQYEVVTQFRLETQAKILDTRKCHL